MILIDKKVGETPLELLNRISREDSKLKDEKLSYAGRLDPMAEGQMLILVGEEENKNRKKYLGFDKEYEAEFLVGFETDTGDVLGLVQDQKFEVRNSKYEKNSKLEIRNTKQIEKIIKDFVNIREQKYPWFSSKTVNGKPLWEYYREGKFDIERPVLNVNIKKIEILNKKNETNSKSEIRNYIFDSIGKVKGNFRQKEILEKWRVAFGDAPPKLSTFKIKILVSSGTYIRALTEEFDFPVCLLKLKRTKICF